MTAITSSQILAFFKGTGTDHEGRRMGEILAWSDFWLESEHDYIQWLFPLKRQSNFNPYAPVLGASTINAFLQSTDLRSSLAKGFRRMVAFYGFVIRTFPDGDIQLDLAPDFPIRSRAWLTSANHNYLRFTRILTSLRVLGCVDEAEALFDVLDIVYRRNRYVIGETSYGFWCASMAIETG